MELIVTTTGSAPAETLEGFTAWTDIPTPVTLETGERLWHRIKSGAGTNARGLQVRETRAIVQLG